MFNQRNPFATFDSALASVRSLMLGNFADADVARVDGRFAGAQRGLASPDGAVAVLEASNSHLQHEGADGREAQRREAERIDQSLKRAFHAVEQLGAALDNFIAAITPLGASGAVAGEAAAGFREMMRDSAAEAVHFEALRRGEILANTKPTGGSEKAAA